MKFSGGAAATPGITWAEDPDTGLYRPGANRLGFAVAGAAAWEIDANGFFIPAADDVQEIGDATHRIHRVYTKAQSFTPALTAVTSNPTLGTGSSVSGFYYDFGDWVTGWARIQFGTAAVNSGSGNYRVSIPFAFDTALYNNNTGVIGIVGGQHNGNGRTGVLRPQATTTANIQQSDTPYQQWSDATPDATGWIANDRIVYSFDYKKA